MCNETAHHQRPDPAGDLDLRGFLKTGAALGAAAAGAALAGTAHAGDNPYADPAEPALPASDMVLDPSRAALVVTDPQIDFLSPDGVTWGVVGESVQENGTVEHIGELFKTADSLHVPTFV